MNSYIEFDATTSTYSKSVNPPHSPYLDYAEQVRLYTRIADRCEMKWDETQQAYIGTASWGEEVAQDQQSVDGTIESYMTHGHGEGDPDNPTADDLEAAIILALTVDDFAREY